ncbi:hypothetical protein LTR04_004484, partial [Oleoguttula sp. CCFEE 6159]
PHDGRRPARHDRDHRHRGQAEHQRQPHRHPRRDVRAHGHQEGEPAALLRPLRAGFRHGSHRIHGCLSGRLEAAVQALGRRAGCEDWLRAPGELELGQEDLLRRDGPEVGEGSVV